MSWSVSFIGTSNNIKAALSNELENLTGDSRKEFETIMPLLVCLVGQNFNNNGPESVIKLSANGHCYNQNGEPSYGSCNVSIQPIDGKLV